MKRVAAFGSALAFAEPTWILRTASAEPSSDRVLLVPLTTNVFYYGDNLGFLRDHPKFPSESIDIVYLDPPFNSNRDYSATSGAPSISRTVGSARVQGNRQPEDPC